MLKHVAFDPQSGQLLSGSFLDYAQPRAHGIPCFGGKVDSTVPAAANWPAVQGVGQAG